MTLVLNGITVDERIEALMHRQDWPGKRTDRTWLDRFPPHPKAGEMPFVQLCSIDHAEFENNGIQRRRSADLLKLGTGDEHLLNGAPNTDYPPGDFDPWSGYLIGFTDYCDAGIFVDLRPTVPRIIYDNLNPFGATHATAFSSIQEFVEFFKSRHGRANSDVPLSPPRG